MTEFERITASPAVLGAFLGSLPCLEGPWDDAFHREFCDKCEAENCDACPHKAERNSPTWWLGLIHTGSGPVRTESRNPYLQQAADLRLEAMTCWPRNWRARRPPLRNWRQEWRHGPMENRAFSLRNKKATCAWC